MNMHRRGTFGILGAAIAAFLGRQHAKAQTTAQEILNDMQIVSTGDVHVSQRAAGSQLIHVDAAGNRYYGFDSVQIVENDGQIVTTGDVWVEQEAAGQQEITLATHDEPCYDGACGSGDAQCDRAGGFYVGDVPGVCEIGRVFVRRHEGVTQLYYHDRDCCTYIVSCQDICPGK